MNFRLSQQQLRALAWITLIFIALTFLYLARPMGSSAKSATELQTSIAAKRAKESNLSNDISSMSQKVQGLRGRIQKLQRRQNAIQADLNVKQDRQKSIQGDLKRSRARLARLRARLAHSRAVLKKRIIEVYKQGEPNMIQVVLSSRGFADMVQRTTYMERIASQDRRIIVTVTKLRGATKKETTKLAGLEREASKLVAVVKSRRDEVAGAKHSLDSRRDQLASVVSTRKSSLARISRSRAHDEEDLAAMQQTSSAVGGMLSGGKYKAGTGQLGLPVNGQFTSPFGTRWGRLHGGIDIAVPTGTPVHASDTGTVRIAGWMGGYGNYICIQHSSSMSTCYGHNSSLRVSVGQSVSKGQVIAASGNTGNSTGPHVHFEVRINGTQVDPMGYL